jgi:hypothetical protein
MEAAGRLALDQFLPQFVTVGGLISYAAGHPALRATQKRTE